MPLSNIYLVQQTQNAVFAAQLRSHLLFVSINVEKSANAKHVAAAKALHFRTSRRSLQVLRGRVFVPVNVPK